jgi:Asp-tRNA(Asn)/Glu-tRNA(Gln) amidotransferase A subunit family amidase
MSGSFPTQCSLSVTQAAAAIREGSLSSLDLVEACLRRIADVEGEVRAWARVCADEARREAERIDRCDIGQKANLPLAGVPIGVKDVFYTSNVETSAASRVLEGWKPSVDAEAVARLKRAGAIVLGKTVTTEFASGDPAPTRNPLDVEHTPGGSSSGSAAAVAAYMCPAALGTQTAGSVLRPAAYCGIVGFKPTYDAVSRAGVLPLAWSLDHVGTLTRTVEDAELIFEQLLIENAVSRPPLRRTFRVGVPDRYFDQSSAEVDAAMGNVTSAMRDSGWHVDVVSLPRSFEAGVAAASVVLPAEVAAAHRSWFPTRRGQYGPVLRSIIESGDRILAGSYIQAQRVRRLAAQELLACCRDIDFLLTPSTPAPAPRSLQTTGDPRYCIPFSCFGMPALSIPAPLGYARMPIGIQLASHPGSDFLLLEAGRELERLLVSRHGILL